jgi:cellulose synthase/poly-beta-1,6-N-acetylglucosamine synthase-like glycosyltransferase
MNLLIKILIITNGLIIFYFLQLVLYGLLSYSYYFRKKKKLNFSIESLTKLACLKNRELPFITLVIPAKDEAEIIETTIDRFLSLIYPKDKLCILIVCDEKEILTKPYE